MGAAVTWPTLCASGAAISPRGEEAATVSVAAALAALHGRRPNLGLLFVSPSLDLTDVLAAAHQVAPSADFLACTTAGELTEHGLIHGGVTCMLFCWDGSSHHIGCCEDLTGTPTELSERLCANLAIVRADNALVGRTSSTTLLLGDGLSPTFEKVVIEMRRALPPDQQIAGGGAGDEGRLERTWVGLRERVFNGVVAAHVFSARRWGVGVGHGLRRASPAMLVTRARQNVVHTLDGRPAIEVYRERARTLGVELDERVLPQFLVENELGVLLFEDVVRIRAPIRVEPGGGLLFAGEVPEGSAVCFVEGHTAPMIEAVREAARTARAGLGEASAAGVLVFSCICRGMMLGDDYDREVGAIRDVFPGVPLAGFLSYGEIARTAHKFDGYHNNTVVVVAVPA
jgi:methyl-accepting chemotaxis protein